MVGTIFNRRRTDSAVRLGVIAIVCFMCVRYYVYYGTADGHVSVQETATNVKPLSLEILSKKSNKTKIKADGSFDECKEISLAWKCTGSKDAIQLFWSLKTILYFRTTPLRLYIYADDTAKYILETMFKTWELPCVYITFLKGSPKEISTAVVAIPNSVQKEISTAVVAIPNSVQKAIYLKSQMRFMSDVKELHNLYESYTKQKTFVNLPEKWAFYPSKDSQVKSFDDLKAFKTQPADITYMDGNEFINSEVEHLFSILRHDGRVYSRVSSSLQKCPCAAKAILKEEPSFPKTNITQVTQCLEYVKYAYSHKRTLLYFFGNEKAKYTDPADISLATQLTFDRFHVLERFAQLWKGPMVVVLYISDVDAYNLQATLAGSFINKRKNIDIHLVFKRKHLYPINDLRNVALKEVKTPYTLFVDIDLVPNPTLYEDLKKYTRKYIIPFKELKTIIIPAFEAFVDITPFPANKTMLLKYMAEKKVDGYKMWRKWNLGHKPTDYPKWMKTDQSYIVKWRDAYEPYVVLATENIPQYEPALLERMGDKIGYGLELFARGYEFRVLPDVFLIHLPHPTSPGTSMWLRDRKYAGCSSKIFQGYKRDVFNKYPDKRY